MASAVAPGRRVYARVGGSPAAEDRGPGRPDAWLWRWTVALLAVGIAGRLWRYLLQFPFWGDECFVGLNLVGQTYAGFFSGLQYVQVAPLLFLWTELTAYQWLGGGELALRLAPLLAGVSAVLLFGRLAWRLLPPAAATLAAGLLAVSLFPVRHACEVKPYAFDLLASVVLLSLAEAWLRDPRRAAPLAALAAGVGLLLGFSYPAVFVAGGVSLALLPAVLRQGWRAKALWAAYNVALLASFLACLQVAARLNSAYDLSVMRHDWSRAFPPMDAFGFLRWLALAHTGSLMAYPAGDKNGGSTVTFLLFAAGLWWCWRSRQWRLLLLALPPFALTFAAACLRRYPYGESARVNQHLAPAVCLLAGAGVVALLGAWFRSEAVRRRWVTVWCVGLLAFGLGLMAYDWCRPYKTVTARECREVAREAAALAGPGTPVVTLFDTDDCVNIPWCLHSRHGEVYSREEYPAGRGGRVVGVRLTRNHVPAGPPADPGGAGRAPVRRSARSFRMEAYRGVVAHAEVFVWE